MAAPSVTHTAMANTTRDPQAKLGDQVSLQVVEWQFDAQ
jgi:hypothetical protein